MPLNQVNNGDSGATARATINDAITQVNTNTTAIAALPATYQPLDADLTAIAALTPTSGDTMQFISGAWKNRTASQAKTTLSLDQVDNTTDLNKPISTATQTALNLKQTANAQTSLYYRVALGETVSRNVVVADQNSLVQFQLGGVGQTLTFPPALTNFQIGAIIFVANSDTSASALTIAAGGGAALYVGAKGTSLAAGENAFIMKISTTEWLRLF